MARIGSGRVKTFSIGFADQEYNELEYARQVARKFDTDHHELVIEPNVLDIIDDLAWYLDEPFGDRPPFRLTWFRSSRPDMLRSSYSAVAVVRSLTATA